MLTPMVLAKCACGWTSRFVGKEDLMLIVSDQHGTEQSTAPHAFDGTIVQYKEERPAGKRWK